MIFLFILAIYGVGLWRYSVPLTGDQKVYLSIALEMKERGSVIIPYLYRSANFLKPPFQYWMTLIGWKIFGFSIFGALVPSVLALVLSAFLVKKLSPGKSNLAAIAFASTVASMTYGSTAQMEIWIVLFYLAAWWWYLDQKLFLSFLMVGIMAWIKGPLYPVLFVMSVFFKAYLDQNLKSIMRPKFILAVTFGVIVGLLWYAAAALTHYQELYRVFFGQENFGKLQTSQGSPLGLWSEFILTLFPVLFLLIASIADPALRARWNESRNFWLAYAVIPVIFFTFFPYRVNTYLYLLTPLIAWMLLLNPKPMPWLKATIGILALLVCLVASLMSFRLCSGGWVNWILGGAIALTLGVWTFSHFRLQGMWIAASSLILVNLFRVGATEMGEWDLRPLRETQGKAFAYRIESGQEDVWHELGLISTAIETPIYRIRTSDEEKAFMDHGGVMILSDEQTPMAGATCNPWRRLKRRTQFPFRELLVSGLSIEDPSLHRIFQICRLSK